MWGVGRATHLGRWPLSISSPTNRVARIWCERFPMQVRQNVALYVCNTRLCLAGNSRFPLEEAPMIEILKCFGYACLMLLGFFALCLAIANYPWTTGIFFGLSLLTAFTYGVRNLD